MKIKLKLENLNDTELVLSSSFCTIPIIMNKTIMFGAYDVDLNISDNIWYQLPEECKKKICNYKEHNIKSMIITVTNITAYNVTISQHQNFKEPITMEELYKDFNRNKRIERFLCECDFPYSNMLVYFQSLGEIYAEFELDDWVYYTEGEKEKRRIKERERRKIRESNKVEPLVIKVSEKIRVKEGIEEKVVKKKLLEKLEEEQSRFEISFDNFFRAYLKDISQETKISKEYLQEIFLNFQILVSRAISNLDYSLRCVMLIIKRAENLKEVIPENVKYQIGYWLTDMQAKIRTEEEKKLFKEIRDKLSIKKVYED